MNFDKFAHVAGNAAQDAARRAVRPDIGDVLAFHRRRAIAVAVSSFVGVMIAIGVVAAWPGSSSPDPVASPTVTAAATTTSKPAQFEEPAAVSEAAPEPSALIFPTTPWPDPRGDPPWSTVPLGLPGGTHLRIGYGPLGFISVNNVERGAVVRLSLDGVVWQETATLAGPDGEEQVSVRDMAVSVDEYLVVGETWTNTEGGSEIFREALWRSRDGTDWTVTDLGVIDEDVTAAVIISTPRGLVLAGALYDEETGTARPKLWLETANGLWTDITLDVTAFDGDGWIEGAAVDAEGLIAWGTTNNGTALVWRTQDFQSWTRATLPGGTNGYVAAVRAFRGGYVAVGQSQTWVSADAVEWTTAATVDDLATDAVSPGLATFRQLYVQDGYLVAVAAVGYRVGAAWCYLDATDCRQFPETVLVSQDAKEWRRLPLPEELDQPPHPIEVDAVLADGHLTVLHTVGDDAVLSILTQVDNAQPLNTEQTPDLPFPVVEPGDDTAIAVGVRHGYPIYTHCGFPIIGPLNGTSWSPIETVEVTGESLQGWGVTVYGFIELTDEDQINYIVNDQVIARYSRDPTEQTLGVCI